jgi:phosphoribosylformylglycinamidine synthase
MPILFTTPAPQTLSVQSHAITFTTHVWVSSSTELSAEQIATLCALLDAQLNATPSTSTLCVISARTGTLSPWSSKAADIAAQCGVVGIRLEQVKAYDFSGVPASKRPALQAALYDRMTQSVHSSVAASVAVLGHELGIGAQAESFTTKQDTLIPLRAQGKEALTTINTQLGLALSSVEIDYLFAHYTAIKRDPTDAELMMFAQANSEHCRHKIFNAAYTVDGAVQKLSMFGHIRTTHAHTPQGTVVAYSDNAAVIGTATVERFRPDATGKNAGKYTATKGTAHGVLKAETHNHPTAISPYAGAATGAGGEIRDEGATGRGATPRAGFTGFSTSLLTAKTPSHLATPNQIMIDGPLGAAAFNNEFGRPALGGYWRAFEAVTQDKANTTTWGYHKPIMMAGGWGTIDAQHAKKQAVRAGDYLIQLGGPGLRIGIGGGAASSMAAGQNDAALDFNSVQRDNAEMQRRAQMVINACMALGDTNPIRSIHDVGAGGLSNAFPEIVDADGLGATIALESIPLGESGLSALEAWCNESQERYTLALAPEDWLRFEALCQRERCPVAHVGVATKKKQFQVTRKGTAPVVDWEMHALLGKMDKLQRSVTTNAASRDFQKKDLNTPFALSQSKGLLDKQPTSQVASASTSSARTDDFAELSEISTPWQALCEQTLAQPTVASKRSLITIGDRTVGGYSHRDPMVGPWQEPVADCAVTMLDYASMQGEAASMGERTPLAIYNAPASGRMAVAEALSNLAAAPVATLDSIKLSCNWMAAASQPAQDAALYATVDATASFCRDMNLGVPVGKDSLSMQVNSPDCTVTSPVSLVVTAYAPLPTISAANGNNRTCAVLTPLLAQQAGTVLMVIKPHALVRLAGSMAQQLFAEIETQITPDLTSAEMRNWWNALQAIRHYDSSSKGTGLALAYHDISDGGTWAAVCEMAFASRSGVVIDVQAAMQALKTTDAKAVLFNEEIGAVIQITATDANAFAHLAKIHGVVAYAVGYPVAGNTITVQNGKEMLYSQSLQALHGMWDSVSASFTAQRDKTQVVAQETDRIQAAGYAHPHLHQHLTFTPSVLGKISKRPKVAILREQGVNSMVEMAYAWTAAGFDAYDVSMTDLIAGRVKLSTFQALVACGGFSYGDVLGAGLGWARSILQNPVLREQFQTFFHRPDTLALGVCNGCQMMSYLDELMPNFNGKPTAFPRFVHNASGRYEARVSMLEVQASPSVFLQGMAGTRLPVAVAHGEGRMQGLPEGTPVAMRFVDGAGFATETYPMNPNGSPQGATSVCSDDGRVTLMMPHPERVFRYAQWSWLPEEADIAAHSPWMQLFHNAYAWCVKQASK